MMQFQTLSRSLLGLQGHLSAQVLASSACHHLLQQLSLGGSSFATSQMRLSSSTSTMSCTSAGSSSDGPVSAATAQEGATNTRPHPSAAGTVGGAVHAWLPSNCSSTERLTVLLLPAAAVSKSWPVAAVQARGVHNRPAGSGGRGKGRGKGRLGVAAAGVQPGTPRQQRWRPQSSSKGAPVDTRQLNARLKDCTTPQQLLQELQQHKLQQQGGILDAIHLATSYHHFGELCQANAAVAGTAAAQQLLQHLGQLLSPVRAQLGPRQLSNIMWSCAYTQHVAPVAQLLADFLQPTILSRANSWDVGNMLWTLASVEQQVPQQQLEQLANALALQADKAVPQDISNSVWALGKLGCQRVQKQLGELLAAFTAAGMLSRATTQDISMLLLGMAYMGQQLPDAQLRLLIDAFVSKCSRASSQELANFLWAVSEQRHVQSLREQMEQLLGALVKQLHRADPQHVANSLLACARLRYIHMQLLRALEQQQHMQPYLAAANPQKLANTAWACGMLGHNSKLLLGGLLQQAVKLLRQDSSRFISQALCNLCWAVAVLDLRQYVPAVLQLVQAAASRDWDSAAIEELQQLYQVHLWLLDNKLAAAEGGKGPGLLQVLSQEQLDACHRARQEVVAASAAAIPSAMQQQVFKALQQLPSWQVPPQQEVLTADNNFSIDIAAVTAAGVRLAVEVDGPSHFISPGIRVDGPTQYRNRALAARGYTVVSIPWWEWAQLRGTEERQQYLIRVC